MSSSSSTSTSPPSDQPTRDLPTAYNTFKHNAALALLIGAPCLILIPPRKLDLYTFSLAGAFILSANQLSVERTGRGLIAQLGYKFRFEYQKNAGEPLVLERKGGTFVENDEKGSLLEERVREREDWRVRRLREEREKLEEGKSYEDLIVDQIWDVWNQEGRKKGGDGDGEKK